MRRPRSGLPGLAHFARGRGHSGWSLIEMIVAMGLGALVLLVVSSTLISTSKVTRSQSERALRQSILQTVMRHLEATLRSSMVAAVSYYRSDTPDAAVLSAQCLQTGFIQEVPKLQTRWRVFLWDATTKKLYMADTLPHPEQPTEAVPLKMTEPQMQALLASDLPPARVLLEGRLIAERVTDFTYSLEEGPLYKVEVEMDVPVIERDHASEAVEHLKATVEIHPRNRF